ncbi:unnamed protein product, partial [Mesorhabditis spiculigera]
MLKLISFFLFFGWATVCGAYHTPCEQGWTYYQLSGLCYKAEIVPPGNFSTRIQHCRSYNAHVASLHNKMDNFFIRTVNASLVDYSLEFGLFYSDELGFYNDDGTPADYFNWDGEQDPPKGNLASGIEKDYFWWYDRQEVIWGGAVVCSKPGTFVETTPYEAPVGCEPGWTYWNHNDKCYKIDLMPLDQFNTRIIHCEQLNSTIGSIHSAEENYFIRNINASLADYSIEFGLFYELERGGWFNYDGSPADYFNWDSEQDKPKGILASEMGPDYTWSHDPQWYLWGGAVLCEKDAQPIQARRS